MIVGKPGAVQAPGYRLCSPRNDCLVVWWRRYRLVAGCAAALYAAAAPVWAGPGTRELVIDLQGPQDNRICLVCHDGVGSNAGDADRKIPVIDEQAYGKSVHNSRACTDCHEDVTQVPHKPVQKVRCGRCHPSNGMPVAVAPGTAKLQEGAHSRAQRLGRKYAPGCANCHGTHDITGPKDVQSRVYRTNIPKTCGRCHIVEATQYWRSVHGNAAAQGKLEAAVCTDCHGEHERLLPANLPSSSVYPSHIPDTCSHCHESARLEKRYGLPKARFSTYRESYHGIASKYGDKTAANCASCHGFHDILPSSDPNSRISKAHLSETCGKCHPGASENFARGTVHLMPSPKRDIAIFWVRVFYRVLIFLLMTQFVGLIVLDLAAHQRRRRRGGSGV